MNWTELFSMQKKLDKYIIKTHTLEEKNLFEEKMLALLVELGELANETRCFKFWSRKRQINDSAILEEYVDNIHFLLSLGLEKGFSFQQEQLEKPMRTLTEQFHKVFTACFLFKQSTDEASYKYLFQTYLELGALLGFSEEAIQKAYKEKNEVNFVRQDIGY